MQLPRPHRVFRLRLHPAHQFRGQRIATERMAIGEKRADLVRTLSVKMFLKSTKRTMRRQQSAASPWEKSLFSHLCQHFWLLLPSFFYSFGERKKGRFNGHSFRIVKRLAQRTARPAKERPFMKDWQIDNSITHWDYRYIPQVWLIYFRKEWLCCRL